MRNNKHKGKIFKALKVLGVLTISMLITYMVYATGNDNLVESLTKNLVHSNETPQAMGEGVGSEVEEVEGESILISEESGELGEPIDLAGESGVYPEGDVENNKLEKNQAGTPTGIAGVTASATYQEKREPIPANAVASRESSPNQRPIGEVPSEGSNTGAKEPTELQIEQQSAAQPQPASQPPNNTIAGTVPASSPPVPASSPPVQPAGAAPNQDLNQYVLDVIKTYPIAPGRFSYLLNNDYANYNGVTTTLSYQNKVLLKAHPSGNRASHCVGITFEVFFKAMQERNRQLGISPDDFNGMNHSQLFDFALNWYAAGPKQTNNIVTAVEKYGVGKGISHFEDARPGDFLDFDRENNTGHTVVLINWIKENDKIIGLRYWSSQQSTRGISYNEEYFNVGGQNKAKYGNVKINSVRIARVLPVSEYKSFR